MHATIFIMALINLANFDLPYLMLFVSHGITFVQVITLDAWYGSLSLSLSLSRARALSVCLLMSLSQ